MMVMDLFILGAFGLVFVILLIAYLVALAHGQG